MNVFMLAIFVVSGKDDALQHTLYSQQTQTDVCVVDVVQMLLFISLLLVVVYKHKLLTHFTNQNEM